MKGLTKYLNDIQEELMDAVLYIQTAREELQDLSEEALIERHRNDKYEDNHDVYSFEKATMMKRRIKRKKAWSCQK